jgi:hypothetical protein
VSPSRAMLAYPSPRLWRSLSSRTYLMWVAVRGPRRVNDTFRASARRPPVSMPLELGRQPFSQGWRALKNVAHDVRLAVQDVLDVHLRLVSYAVFRVGGSR